MARRRRRVWGSKGRTPIARRIRKTANFVSRVRREVRAVRNWRKYKLF